MKSREPSPAPQIAPKVRLDRTEMLGLPFLFILPILAVLGVFGPKTESAKRHSQAFEVSVQYPSRIRYQNRERLIVRVENRTDAQMSGVSLAFDPAYIHAFAEVAIDPAPKSPYHVDLSELGPGESRLVAVQLTANEYGAHQGWVSLFARGHRAQIPLSTFVFP